MKPHTPCAATRRIVDHWPGCLALFVCLAPPLHAQAETPPYTFTTLAGLASKGHLDGAGLNAQFDDPEGVTVDHAGNIYVADTLNSTIRKVDPAGTVTTLAGLAQIRGAADGVGPDARFDFPKGIAVDDAGNVYVADMATHTIRKITQAGRVTTLAGQAYSPGAADGAGATARFCFPSGVAVDKSGNVYVADCGNYAIRKITPGGLVTTFAGTLLAAGAADGSGTAARFYSPKDLVIDGVGDLYVIDNFTVRRVSPAGVVVTLAGRAGIQGSDDGSGDAARFGSPQGVGADSAGNLYVTEGDWHTIRRITRGGVVTTFAGRIGVSGASDGPLADARFNYPSGLAADSAGNLVVADTFNNAIRQIRIDGTVLTLAGVLPSRSAGSADGTGPAARFDHPRCVAVDAAGNLYVADELNHTIRKVSPNGSVSTLAGTAGERGGVDGRGCAARFNLPSGVAVNRAGEVFVADTGNQSIRKITPDGAVSTIAGSLDPALWGSADGAGVSARFHDPAGIAVDAAGNLYVADDLNFTVRRIAPDGTVSTLAGRAGSAGSVDGSGADARFTDPTALALDPAGNVYVSDGNSSNATIRKITAAGAVTTLATVDAGARGLAVDAAGTVFVACTSTSSIQEITPHGATRVAGGNLGAADGVGLAAQFYEPGGIAIDAAGMLYVADTGNNTVRLATCSKVPAITRQPQSATSIPGSAATFTVAATGWPSPTYQWSFNGAAIPGAVGNSLTLAYVQAADAGSYTVTASNDSGSVTSNPATLTITAAPTPPPSGAGGSGGVSSSSGGGGGASSLGFLAALLALAAVRALVARHNPVAASTPVAGRGLSLNG